MNIFKTKRGRLNRYAFACGYRETFEDGAFNACLRMPLSSTGVFLVTAQGDDWRVLYNGRSIRAARRAFDDYKKSVCH